MENNSDSNTYLDEPSARWGPLVNTITTDFTIDIHFDWGGVLPSPGQISSSNTKENGIDGDILIGHPSGNLYIDSKHFKDDYREMIPF